MSPRRYHSPGRDAAAAQTRERIVAAAAKVLGTAEGMQDFSLEAVAKAAGVTRLTVYNQFGSRRAVLEAAFDQVALRGGLHRLAEAVALPDPHAAIGQVITIFCEFWSFDRGAIGLLHAAGSSSQEFAVSVTERNERRRRLFAAVVRRLDMPSKVRRDLVDTLFALTSFAFFAQLTGEGRGARAVERIIQQLARDAVRHAENRS